MLSLLFHFLSSIYSEYFINNQIIISMPQYFQQTRSQNQIILSDKLARLISQLNIKRIQKQSIKPQKLSNKSDYLYVCITGLPPLNNQFQDIGIPGQKIVIYPQCFQPHLSQQQHKNRLKYVTLQIQAYHMHKILQNRKDKKIVIICHSFGTSIMSVFFKIYGQIYIKYIIGIIPIGCYPIRALTGFKDYIVKAKYLSQSYLYQNIDLIYQQHCKDHKQKGLPIIKNKYSYVGSLLAFGKGIGFDDMFQYNRCWFPVLKCFIYGQQDNRIAENLLNQIALFYCYRRKFQNNLQIKLKEAYKQMYGKQCQNIQQRFIFNVPGGKHTIHVQKKYKPLVSKIINQFLDLLQIVY